MISDYDLKAHYSNHPSSGACQKFPHIIPIPNYNELNKLENWLFFHYKLGLILSKLIFPVCSSYLPK